MKTLNKVNEGIQGGNSNIGGGGIGEGVEEDGVEFLNVREQSVADELREVSEDEESGLLQMGRIGGNALEHEREELRPGVIRKNTGSKLGNGVAELLGDGFGVMALEGGQEDGLEGGLGGRREERPHIGRRRRGRGDGVACKELAKENGGHGAKLEVRRELKQMSEFEREGVRIGLLTEIEGKFSLRSVFVRGRHEL